MDELKYVSEHERAAMPSDCFAGPNHSFPINDQAHVYAAAHLYGRATDPEAVKAKIISIAKRKGFALPDGWGDGGKSDDMDSGKSFDMLVFQGGQVKSLGNNKFGGHLVLFTTKQDPDTAGDYFDSDTDFDFEDGDRRSGYYNHGFDVKIGNTKIGTGSLTKDKVGVWLEAQLKERDEYCDAIMEMVKEGALGLSSGALSHLVRREAKNKAGTLNYVTHWPIGEWSGTPTPAEPRTLAIPLKMWARNLKGAALGDYAEHDMVASALGSLNDKLMGRIHRTLGSYDGEKTSPDEKSDAICAGMDEHCQTGKKMVKAMVGGNQSFAKSILDEAFKGDFVRPEISTVRELEQLLRDAGVSRKQATTWAKHGFTSLRDAGEPEPITPEVKSPPPIDEAAQRKREFSYQILAARTEALRLAYGS